MSVTIGNIWPRAIYGMPAEESPVTGIPADAERVKLKFRHDQWARAFVKTATGIRHFIIAEEKDGTLVLAYEQGKNQRFK